MLDRLLREIGVVSEGPLAALIVECRRVSDHLAAASTDDRLAGSYPFLTMLSTAVCGWLMKRQADALDGEAPDFAAMKRAAVDYYLQQVVPEAQGLAAQATAGAELLYSLSDEALASA